MDITDDEYELNAAIFERKEVGDLSDVKNFDEALERHGYLKGDKVPRRILVVIFDKARKNISAVMAECAKTGNYDGAKEYRARLTAIKNQFENRQMDIVRSTIREQESLFVKAKYNLSDQLKTSHEQRIQSVESVCTYKDEDLSMSQTIKRENLDENIERTKLPSIKYSRRFIELLKAEKYLNRLNQYDDAERVRLMIEKLQPIEEKKFLDEFHAQLDLKRHRLREDEQKEQLKLSEAVKVIEWKDIRKRESDRVIFDNRLSFHKMNMDHFNTLETKKHPETALKPSAIWQKRKGFSETSSALRGKQLLNLSKGFTVTADQDAVDTLVDKHEFDAPLDGTLTL